MFSLKEALVKEKFKEVFDNVIVKYGKQWDELKNTPIESLNDEQFLSVMYVSAWHELNSFMRNPEEFDSKTEFSRENNGDYLIDRETFEKDPKYHLFISLKFIWEYILSIQSNTFPLNKLSCNTEAVQRLDKIDERVWNVTSGGFTPPFSWIVNIMPYEIYRNFLSSPELKQAITLSKDIEKERDKLKKNVESIVAEATKSINYLSTVRAEAKDLEERLTNVKREGNFKLLAKAFSTLKKNKSTEVRYAQTRMWAFIIALIFLPIFIFNNAPANDLKRNYIDFIKYVPIISLELLFFYFMRLFYVEVTSIKSQLIQIDLRLNLCEFIYDYIETRDKTHSEKVSESWKGFEALIFSPIQPNEDKIPSVMDGTDALVDLAGKILKAK